MDPERSHSIRPQQALVEPVFSRLSPQAARKYPSEVSSGQLLLQDPGRHRINLPIHGAPPQASRVKESPWYTPTRKEHLDSTVGPQYDVMSQEYGGVATRQMMTNRERSPNNVPMQEYREGTPMQVHGKVMARQVHYDITPKQVHHNVTPSEVHLDITPRQVHNAMTPSLEHYEKKPRHVHHNVIPNEAHYEMAPASHQGESGQVHYEMSPKQVHHNVIPSEVLYEMAPKQVHPHTTQRQVHYDMTPASHRGESGQVRYEMTPRQVHHNVIPSEVQLEISPASHQGVPGQVLYEMVPRQVDHNVEPRQVYHEMKPRLVHPQTTQRHVHHEMTPAFQQGESGQVYYETKPRQVDRIMTPSQVHQMVTPTHASQELKPMQLHRGIVANAVSHQVEPDQARYEMTPAHYEMTPRQTRYEMTPGHEEAPREHWKSPPERQKQQQTSSLDYLNSVRDVGARSPTMSDLKAFAKECTKQINEYRAKHGVPGVKNRSELNRLAQEWAQRLADKDEFAHSNQKYKDTQLGENLTMKYDSRATDYSAKDAVDNWYKEIVRYDFAKASGPNTGHFTQVVWKDTQEFGVGKAKTKGGKFLVVGNFYPPGNVLGRYAENVLPPTSGKIELPVEDKAEIKKLEAEMAGVKLGENTKITNEENADLMDIVSESTQTKTQTTYSPDGKAIVKTTKTTTRTDRQGRKHITTTETTVQK